ncbi:LPS export ABC transporter periplasmic protein LptC [Candidatus Pelagibacter sp.]|nr:LPS export ABC transporter periplasmic protein LptC [Candidatus Pelagibacter sp.]
MNKKKILKIFLVLLVLIILLILFLRFFNENKKNEEINLDVSKQNNIESNLIKGISFFSKDKKGNEYILKAEEGEVDLSNDKIIYLKKITAQVVLNNSEDIIIISDFGKYNIENYDTIFSKNVLIKYLDSRISSNYMEFSINKNLMTITKNVVYSNKDNFLNADIVEFNTDTKKVNIFMYDSSEKVKIISKN